MKIKLLLSAVLFVGGCGNNASDGPAAQEDGTASVETTPTVATIDQETASLLKDPLTTEALEWLNAPQGTKHVLWKTWDTAEARKQIKAIYDAGAPKVWAASPTEIKGSQVLAQFVIELPAEPKARQQIFAWIHQWEKEIDDDAPTKDQGQKYYEINLDL
jgi:hypothetical protein